MRCARLVLRKASPEHGDLLASLVERHLKPPPFAASFPCAPGEIDAFVEKIAEGEYGGSVSTTARGHKVFVEMDQEDDTLGAYAITTDPSFGVNALERMVMH